MLFPSQIWFGFRGRIIVAMPDPALAYCMLGLLFRTGWLTAKKRGLIGGRDLSPPHSSEETPAGLSLGTGGKLSPAPPSFFHFCIVNVPTVRLSANVHTNPELGRGSDDRLEMGWGPWRPEQRAGGEEGQGGVPAPRAGHSHGWVLFAGYCYV